MPLKSGGALDNEYVCGRANCGLLTMGKKPCPSGEQITNGTFATGDFTGWDHSGYIIQTGGAQSGTYCLWAYPSGWVEQTLGTPILVDCIDEFSFWVYLSGPGGDGTFTVLVTYTDDTTEEIILSESTKNTWVKKTVTGLTSGKTVRKVKVTGAWSANPHLLDTISLTGTG